MDMHALWCMFSVPVAYHTCCAAAVWEVEGASALLLLLALQPLRCQWQCIVLPPPAAAGRGKPGVPAAVHNLSMLLGLLLLLLGWAVHWCLSVVALLHAAAAAEVPVSAAAVCAALRAAKHNSNG
jgi:hypothetical protein